MAVAIMAAAFTACGSGGGKSSAKIKMTTEAGGEFIFHLAGSGTATVDWGDGSEKVTLTLHENTDNFYGRIGVRFEHTYPSASIRTITINGENITRLNCGDITSLDVSRCTELILLDCWGNFTSLDVSKNTALTSLHVSSKSLASLDVSKNTALTYLNVFGNLTSLDVSKNTTLAYVYVKGQLSAFALNALFGALHSNTVPPAQGLNIVKIINIYDNPGTADCDRSIAEKKGWTVIGY